MEQYKIFRAHGTSMWPCLRAGDELLVRPSPPYRVGDIVALRIKGKVVVHRIIERRNHPSQVLTKGDNKSLEDLWAEMDEIMGKVSAINRPGVGYALPADKYRSVYLFFSVHLPKVFPLAFRIQKKTHALVQSMGWKF